MREKELVVLLLASRENFNRFKPLLKENLLTKEGKWFIDQIGAYYSKNPSAVSADINTFETFFWSTRAGHLKPGVEKELYEKLFEALKKSEYDDSLTKEILEHYVALDYASKIQDKVKTVLDGRGRATEISDVGGLVTRFNEEVSRTLSFDDVFASADLTETTKRIASLGLEWRLEELNRSLGPLRLGDFIIVAARPEVGKTTWMAAEVSYMAEQLKAGEGPIVVVNNEEQSDKVRMRVVQSSLGLTVKTIMDDLEAAEAEFAKRIKDPKNVRITRQDADMSTQELELLFAETKPSLIVFDQLDKVKYRGYISKEAREDERLAHVYLWARKIAARYCPVIAISQASADAEGVKWLHQGMLRGSKTDKPGEADAVVMIGKTFEPGEEDKRFISIAKNKLVGGPRTDPALRHGKFEVTILPEIARYKGVF